MNRAKFVFVKAKKGSEFAKKLTIVCSKLLENGYDIHDITKYRHTSNYEECWAFEAIIECYLRTPLPELSSKA